MIDPQRIVELGRQLGISADQIRTIDAEKHRYTRIVGQSPARSIPESVVWRRAALRIARELLASDSSSGTVHHVTLDVEDSLTKCRELLPGIITERIGIQCHEVRVSADTAHVVSVWCKLADGAPATAEQAESIRTAAVAFLAPLEARLGRLEIVSGPPEPHLSSVILMAVRTQSPISDEDLVELVRRRGAAAIGLTDVRRILDRLAKLGLVIYQTDLKAYAITEEGLRQVPGRRRRNSPDIQRALALRRRRH